MFLQAEDGQGVKPAEQGILLYLYTEDLVALREHLIAQGIECPAIHFPEYMPSAELAIRDPDGYGVIIGHWGKSEHDELLKWLPGHVAYWAHRSPARPRPCS